MKKRPKVRYKVNSTCRPPWERPYEVSSTNDSCYSALCECTSRSAAKRIAAALNLQEAVKRGEIEA